MSNKVVAILLAVFLGLGAYVVYQQSQQRQAAQQKNSLISSVTGAFKSGMSIQCAYETKNGTVEIYIRDGALRYDSTLPSFKGRAPHYIYKDDVATIWSRTKGAIFRDVRSRDYEITTPAFIPVAEALASLEPYKDLCKITRFEHTIFVAPQDVGLVELSNPQLARDFPKSWADDTDPVASESAE